MDVPKPKQFFKDFIIVNSEGIYSYQNRFEFGSSLVIYYDNTIFVLCCYALEIYRFIISITLIMYLN